MKTFRSSVCGFVVLFAFFQTSVKAQQEVTFPSGDGQARGLPYLPEGPGPHPAIAAPDLKTVSINRRAGYGQGPIGQHSRRRAG